QEDLVQPFLKGAHVLLRHFEQSLPVRNVEASIRVRLQFLAQFLELVFQQIARCLILFKGFKEIDSLPTQRVHRQRVEIQRVNASLPKTFDESHAVIERVIWHEIGISGNQTAQVLAKSDVDWWNIIERADTNIEHVSRSLGSLCGQAMNQVGM